MFKRLRGNPGPRESDRPWEEIGGIAVDSGIVWIGDPVYGLVPSKKEASAEWKPFVAKAHEAGLLDTGFAAFEPFKTFGSLGLVVNSGGSTGIFPVEARRDEQGLIVELRIRFG